MPELATEPVHVERFEREARAVGRLGHPNIVQVTDFRCAPGEPPFLVMELLEGEPLTPLLRRGRLEPGRAARLTLQTLAALEAAHQAGVVHRDLKPPNVFLVPIAGGGELVKLLDFGVAKLMDTSAYRRLTATGVLVGTPRYAAPEQFDTHTVGPRTDVYAAGALLYSMLTGRPPFLSSEARLLIDIHDKEPTDPGSIVPSLPGPLVEIVRRAMKKRPEERFDSARAMAAALEQHLAHAASAPRSVASLGPATAPSVSFPPTASASAAAGTVTAPSTLAPSAVPPTTRAAQEATLPPTRAVAPSATSRTPWLLAALVMFAGGVCLTGFAVVYAVQRDRHPTAAPSAPVAPAIAAPVAAPLAAPPSDPPAAPSPAAPSPDPDFAIPSMPRTGDPCNDYILAASECDGSAPFTQATQDVSRWHQEPGDARARCRQALDAFRCPP